MQEVETTLDSGLSAKLDEQRLVPGRALGHSGGALPSLVHLRLDPSAHLIDLLLDIRPHTSGEGASIGAPILSEAKDTTCLFLGMHEVK